MSRLSTRALPPYQFLPGKAPHPEKIGGYLYGDKREFSKLSESFLSNDDFCYALDLMEFSFYWEAHIYLEGLWHQVRKSRKNEAAFLQSLIIFCAAGVKELLGSTEAATAHRARALELMATVSNLAEFKLDTIATWIKEFDFKRPTSFPISSREK